VLRRVAGDTDDADAGRNPPAIIGARATEPVDAGGCICGVLLRLRGGGGNEWTEKKRSAAASAGAGTRGHPSSVLAETKKGNWFTVRVSKHARSSAC
jgi:hypothetical protein